MSRDVYEVIEHTGNIGTGDVYTRHICASEKYGRDGWHSSWKEERMIYNSSRLPSS